MTGGMIVAEGPPSTLGDRRDQLTRVEFELPDGAPPLPDAVAGAFAINGRHAMAATDRPTRLLHDVTAWALATGVDLESLTVTRPSLEDVYLQLTAGGDAEDAEATP
jgi:ABC-2 type transport system ATP-binding protein